MSAAGSADLTQAGAPPPGAPSEDPFGDCSAEARTSSVAPACGVFGTDDEDEPAVPSSRSRIRQRRPYVSPPRAAAARPPDTFRTVQGEAAELQERVAREEDRWANYESMWPSEIVEKLRSSVWYPRGFIQSNLDSLEARTDYRQAWVIGLKGCRCNLYYADLGPGDPGPIHTVQFRFDGTNVPRFGSVSVMPQLRKNFSLPADIFWTAHFEVPLGVVRLTPRGSAHDNPLNNKAVCASWELRFVPPRMMEALIVCLWYGHPLPPTPRCSRHQGGKGPISASRITCLADDNVCLGALHRSTVEAF